MSVHLVYEVSQCIRSIRFYHVIHSSLMMPGFDMSETFEN